MDDRRELLDLVAEMRARLEWWRECGLDVAPPGERDAAPVSAAVDTRVAMIPETPAAAPAPEALGSLADLRAHIGDCQRCKLCSGRTQIVFGVGNPNADLVFVGEAPGRDEDLKGEPFVGPAGKLLDRALVAAGIDRDEVYVTNVVKHFKWEPRGKRRIHEKPNAAEIAACRPWLEAEIDTIDPEFVVCLGATAAQALLGKQFRVSRQRGELIPTASGPTYMATVHPSSILRAPDGESRARETDLFVADLASLARRLKRAP